MALVKFNNTSSLSVAIPVWFITDYMPQASSGHIKVYLYLYMLHQTQVEEIPLEEVSKKLDMLYSEFLSSLEYWNKEGVLNFNHEKEDTFTLSFATTKPIDKTLTPQGQSNVKPIFYQQTRPHYSPEEIMLYKNQHSSISTLFQICEKYLGRLLSTSDQQILYGFYDWLNMPLDLIEFLVEYCASNNHTHMRYIEKVALGWHEQGITSVSDAKDQVAISSKYRTILKALGMSGETITKHQRDFLDKWLNDYKLSVEIILEACNRTVAYSAKPSLNYLSSILEKWHKKGIKTIEDIAKLDQKHMETQQSTPLGTKKPVNKNPYFTSTYSHNWDLDELERKELEYIKRKYSGGNS